MKPSEWPDILESLQLFPCSSAGKRGCRFADTQPGRMVFAQLISDEIWHIPGGMALDSATFKSNVKHSKF